MKSKKNLSLLINPFVRIAGGKALSIGIVIFVASILLAYCGNMVFDGILHINFLEKMTLLKAFIIPAVCLITLIIVLYITGCFLSKSSIRFIDVAGTVTLSRAPLFLISLAFLILGVYESNILIVQSLLAQNLEVISIIDWLVFMAFLVITIICFVWVVLLSYKAFSISCNVNGVKGVVSFSVALLVSEVIVRIVIYQIGRYLL